MAEENKKENGGMMKVAGFIVDKRNLIFLIFVILTVFSAVSRNWSRSRMTSRSTCRTTPRQSRV